MEKYINSFELKVGDCLYYYDNFNRKPCKALIEGISVKVYELYSGSYKTLNYAAIKDENNQPHYVNLDILMDEFGKTYYYTEIEAYDNMLPF